MSGACGAPAYGRLFDDSTPVMQDVVEEEDFSLLEHASLGFAVAGLAGLLVGGVVVGLRVRRSARVAGSDNDVSSDGCLMAQE